MTRRPRRLYPATLTALVILAACVLTAVSLIQQMTGHAPLVPFADLGRHLREWRLNGYVATYAGIVAAVLGLVLLYCALVPGQPRTMPLAAEAADADGAAGPAPLAGVSRPGLRTALAAALIDVDGVDSVRVWVRQRRVKARVRTGLIATAGVRDAVRDAAQRRLDQAGLARRPDVQVTVQVRRRTAA